MVNMLPRRCRLFLLRYGWGYRLAMTLVCLIIIVYLREVQQVFSGRDNGLESYDGSKGQRSIDGHGDRKVWEYRKWRYEHRNDPRSGPGELGAGVTLAGQEAAGAVELTKKEAFNIVASDKIALNRSLTDNRDPLCRKLSYPSDLPSASVVIIFHNEAWSPLLRTVHSVVNRSPPHLLHEVILLNDFSDRESVMSRLPGYITKTWPDGVVRLVHAPQRSGLIRAKVLGAEAATGDVIIFLDSHCEANEGWLEPMLARIKEKRSAVLCPSIDHISSDTLQYSYVGSGSRGGFWWSLHFSWRPIPGTESRRRVSSTDPIRSPTMAGGLLAVDRKYFFEIGAYDTGMDVWGGENLEMSFRVWMCGGSLEFIPCSRVGHIFRSSHPYTFPGNKDTHGLNSKRLADVWMDDYKRLFYAHRKGLLTADAGDISERVALRQRLGCKSFQWYLNNVYPEKFIPDENVVGYGMIKNEQTNLCLDTMGKDEKTSFDVSYFTCQNGASANEIFSLTHRGELRREESCSQSVAMGGQTTLRLTACGDNPNSIGLHHAWEYDRVKRTLTSKLSGLCLDAKGGANGSPAILRPCDGQSTQQWTIEHML